MRLRRVLKGRQALAVFLTVAIIGALLFIPQASAITVEVSITPTTIIRGYSATVGITINIGAGENIPIQSIRVVIDGSEYTATPMGGLLTPPNSIIPSITLVTPPPAYLYTPGYGYGYGYLFGYGLTPAGVYGYGYGYPYGYGYGFIGPTTLQYLATLYTGGLSEGRH